MLAFEFDRARIRRQLKPYSLVLLAQCLFWFLAVCLWLFPVVHTPWIVGLLMICLLAMLRTCDDYNYWFGVLRSCLKRQGTALAVNRDGIIVNATGYPLGQLFWNEIEKMYPAEETLRLLAIGWKRMPVISRQRGLVVLLKDGTDFQSRCGSHWRIGSAFRNKSCRGKNRWLFIPEMMLTTTADDVMMRLNEFYTAQVRESE